MTRPWASCRWPSSSFRKSEGPGLRGLPRSPTLCAAWWFLRLHPSSHVRPAASREPYRASSRSKCSSRAPSPTTAWKPRAGSFVYLELHAVPVPAAFVRPHIYPIVYQGAWSRSCAVGPAAVILALKDRGYTGSRIRTAGNAPSRHSGEWRDGRRQRSQDLPSLTEENSSLL
jgi:hypothetical protein